MKKLFTFILALMSISAFAQTNLVVNPNFTDGHDGWTLSYQKPADTTAYAITYEDGIQLVQTTAATGRLDIVQDITVTPNTPYELSFEYKATAAKLRIWSFEVSESDKWIYLGDSAAVDPLRTNNSYYPVAEEWTPVTTNFTTVAADTVTTFRLQFRAYKSASTTLALRNVSLIEMSTTDALENVTVNNNNKVTKVFKNGEFLIIKDDKVYTIFGTEKK